LLVAVLTQAPVALGEVFGFQDGGVEVDVAKGLPDDVGNGWHERSPVSGLVKRWPGGRLHEL